MQLIYKIIYQPFVNSILRSVNKWIHPLLPEQVKLPPSGILQLNIEGRILKLATNQTNYGTQLIFWEGYTNFEYVPIFIDLVKQTNSFFDIGANIGLYSLLAAHLNPNMKITAFEPASGPSHYLRKNVKLNQFTNIQIEETALAGTNGSIDFYEVKSSKYRYLKYNLAGEGNTGSKTTERNFVINQVQAITPDEYIRETKMDKLDLIKIDTEGTEHLILGKAHKILKDFQPIIICETLFNTIESELDNLLRSYGYEFYNHTDKGLYQVDTLKRDEDNGVRNCFFVHPSKKHWIIPFLAS